MLRVSEILSYNLRSSKSLIQIFAGVYLLWVYAYWCRRCTGEPLQRMRRTHLALQKAVHSSYFTTTYFWFVIPVFAIILSNHLLVHNVSYITILISICHDRKKKQKGWKRRRTRRRKARILPYNLHQHCSDSGIPCYDVQLVTKRGNISFELIWLTFRTVLSSITTERDHRKWNTAVCRIPDESTPP